MHFGPIYLHGECKSPGSIPGHIFKGESEFKWLYIYDEEWQGPPAFYLNTKADLCGRDSH